MATNKKTGEAENQSKTPAPELQSFKGFVGSWKIEGKNFPAAPEEPETPVHGEDTYEWLPGNFYLVNRWQHLFKEGGHIGIGILGYDEAEKKLFTRGFDNLGFERKYFLAFENNTLTFSGDKERATRAFSDDGKSYVERWEIRTDTNEWVPLCVMNGTKV